MIDTSYDVSALEKQTIESKWRLIEDIVDEKQALAISCYVEELMDMAYASGYEEAYG